MTTTTTNDIDSNDIRDLRSEAVAAGDEEQVAICDAAIQGDEDAWAECEQVIVEARLQ